MVQSKELIKYTGKIQLQPTPGEKYQDEILYPYLPDDELINAVNLAITLKRPLLLEGEPGGGKSQLARAIAYELKLPYKYYCAKSTSKKDDLIYQFDTIGRLRDAQLASTFIGDPAEQAKIKNPETYIEYGPLGQAFLNSQQQTVVLIDEIDKADTDFPNDLLEVLENKEFTVKELNGQIIKADLNNMPIIIITSNSEKKLSNAFLRRCLYYYVELPDKDRLKAIINARFTDDDDQPIYDQQILDQALEIFMNLREAMENDTERQTTKIISTSEWIDWCEAIQNYTELFKQQLEDKTLPLSQVLLKNQKDRESYLELDNITNQSNNELDFEDED